MKVRVTAAALALLLSTPCLVFAEGSGQSGAGHVSSGQVAGASHGTTSPARGAAGHIPSATTGTLSTAPQTPPTPPEPPSTARSSHGHSVLGMSVPLSSIRADLFLADPSTYAPHVAGRHVPHLAGSSFGGVSLGLYTRPLSSGWSGYGYTDMPPAQPPQPQVDSGTLRLDVQPMSAQVFVDGEFVGTVEDFYHALAGINLSAGSHHLEFRAPGYETLVLDVRIEASRTITYRGVLTPHKL